MIRRRYQAGKKSFLRQRDVLWLVLVAGFIALGGSTWRQAYVEEAPAREYQIPAAPDDIGVPELGPPGRAQPPFL